MFHYKRFCLLFVLIFGHVFSDVPAVLVTVAPHQFFVDKIAKGTMKVQLLVPAGASAHTYEPTARQMMAVSKAVVWFRIGEPFENRAMQAFKSHHPDMKIVDLREGVDLIKSSCHCCAGSEDLHFWLSARQAQIQAKTIADALSQAFPGYANFYQSNYLAFQNELKDLDAKITAILAPLTNRRILVSHPAYAYFCRDYQLEQYSIEMEGKDPTPQQATKILDLARKFHLKTIFIQMQYNNKAAKLFSEALGARLVVLDPYSENFVASMLEIAHAFAGQ